MLYCQQCGASNADDARFCNQCGGKIAHAGEPGGPLTVSADASGTTMPGHRELEASAPKEPEPIPSSTTRSSHPPRRASEPPPERASLPGRAEPSQGFDVSTMSLSAIGVRSRGKAWAVLLGLVVLFVGLGAGGMWLAMHASEESASDPVAEGDEHVEPAVPEEVEIGDALPEGAEPPGVDFIPGTPRPSKTTPREHASGSSTRPATQGNETQPRSGGTGTRPSNGTASSGGTSSSGSSHTASNGTSSGSSNTGSTGSSNTGSTGSSNTGSSGSSGSASEPDWEAMAEDDTEMDDYANRVRQAVRAYYARRAQTCFEHETRNEQSVRGTVVIGFDIQADGNISNTEVVRNTTGIDTLGRCLASQVDTWRLPPPPEGAAPLAMQMPFSR